MSAPPGPPGPIPLLLLMPHSGCNCRCVMCDIWKDRRGTELPVERLRAWRDDLHRLGVVRVCLTGGEPLMHSRIDAFCAVLADAGIAVTLLTTGLLLPKHAAVIGRCCDEVVVSLDGPPDVHDRIRRTRTAFDLLRAGTEALRRDAAHVRVSARCTVQRANARHLRATVRAAEGLGVSTISFLAADVSTEAFGRAGAAGASLGDVVVGVEDLPGLAAEIDALEAERPDAFASGFIVESPGKLRRRVLGHFEALAGLRPWTAPTCNAPWVSAVVESDGAVRPCFFHAPIGNVFRDGGLAAVVTGAAADGFRRTLDVETNDVCRRCVCSLNLRPADARLGRAMGAPA